MQNKRGKRHKHKTLEMKMTLKINNLLHIESRDQWKMRTLPSCTGWLQS